MKSDYIIHPSTNTSRNVSKLYQENELSKPSAIKSNDTMTRKYLMCVAAASVAETCTYPLDLTKTRLQLQGEVAGGRRGGAYRGMIRTAVGVAKKEGIGRLWRGVQLALLRHAVYTGFRMTAYEKIRDLCKNTEGGFPLRRKVMAAMASGGAGQFLASPTDLMKTQLQMEGRRRLRGEPPRFHGAVDALGKIVSSGGVAGLWRGCWPNVQRAALVNLGDLSTYDTVKTSILTNTSMKDNSITHALSSVCAGFVGASMGTPADVVKARMMNQPTDGLGRGLDYKNSLDCFLKTIQGEGFWALYKGFVPCWTRMAPWSLTFWLSFEQIRKHLGAKNW